MPAVVVSPYITRGTIDHTVYEHSSIPATVERLFGLPPLTKRDASAASLGHLVGPASARTDAPATLPAPADSGVPDCLEATLAADLRTAPAYLSGPLEPALAGFVHLALRRDLISVARGDSGLIGPGAPPSEGGIAVCAEGQL